MKDGPLSRPEAARDGGDGSGLDAAEVAAFLRRNPDFLASHPDLLAVLTPPERNLADNVMDLQSAMIRRVQADQRTLRERYRQLVVTTRGNLASQSRVHEAVLAVMGARTFEHLIEIATTDLAVHLDVDVVGLCVEAAACGAPHSHRAGVRVLPQGTVDRLLGPGKPVALRSQPAEAVSLAVFGGGAGLAHSAAFLRLDVGEDAPAGLVGLGSRDEERFQSGQGTELLTFLGGVLSRSIRSWLALPG